MTAISLSSSAGKKAAFSDAHSAAEWLAHQPRANALAMLSELHTQLRAYNVHETSPRERFKTLEVLRKTIFAVSGDCQRRYENKPLPLLPAEQLVLDAVRGLWRACAVGYQRCLQACLERDESISSNSGKVAHRIFACLRMEQFNGYLALAEPEGGFWRLLHAVFASAERLGVTLDPVEDRLLGETSESTVSGQYSMALLLHLACPFSASRNHFAAMVRWLARWREQAKVVAQPDKDPKSCCICLDLSKDRPIHDPVHVVGTARWLSLNGVMRKIRKRIEMLTAGDAPENLKLGTGLTSEACIALLTRISDHLCYPSQPEADLAAGAVAVKVAVGLENIHRALGGKGLKGRIDSTSHGSKLSADQIAIFGHVVESELDGQPAKTENWWLNKKKNGGLQLLRPTDAGDLRVAFKGLLALQLPQHQDYVLGLVSRLESRGEAAQANLQLVVNPYLAKPQALVAEVREKGTGKTLRYPALLLPDDGSGRESASIILPAGVAGRALSMRLYDEGGLSPLDWQLGALVERNSECEHWSLKV